MKVALVQVASSTCPAENLRIVEEHSSIAAAAGASLVIFPEAMMHSFATSPADSAEPVDGPWATAVSQLADRLQLNIAVGMFTTSPSGKLYNTLLFVGPNQLATYHKSHLFDAYSFRESDTFTPGNGPVVVNVHGVTIGFAICYDLRFSQHFVDSALLGAEVMIVPASWAPGPGKIEQWNVLTRARALDSTCFVVACGQAAPATSSNADQAKPTGIGHSLVISPNGQVIDQLGAAPGMLITELDLAQVARTRAEIPVLSAQKRSH